MNKDKGNEDKCGRKVVFILSETRSGSTWLSFVLGSHTGSVHLGEYNRLFTMPGHVVCRLCEAKGLKECEILHDISEIEKERAYEFAFERFKKSTLIDCSKRLDWFKNFIGTSTFQVKAIHLIRDPRAWFASEKRRNIVKTADDAMARWLSTNKDISSKLDELSVSYTTSFYDDLCVMPDLYLSGLCDYIGMPFDKDALNYWKMEHHGLGGNGAAFNNLQHHPQAKLVTGDDEFYQKNAKKQFYDSRWLDELSSVERNSIEKSDIVKEYLSRHNRDFAHFDRLLVESKARHK